MIALALLLGGAIGGAAWMLNAGPRSERGPLALEHADRGAHNRKGGTFVAMSDEATPDKPPGLPTEFGAGIDFPAMRSALSPPRRPRTGSPGRRPLLRSRTLRYAALGTDGRGHHGLERGTQALTRDRGPDRAAFRIGAGCRGRRGCRVASGGRAAAENVTDRGGSAGGRGEAAHRRGRPRCGGVHQPGASVRCGRRIEPGRRATIQERGRPDKVRR